MLTEDMIRIVKCSIGANGHAVRGRNLVVFIDDHMLKDARGRWRRFERQGAARAAARKYIVEQNQLSMQADITVESVHETQLSDTGNGFPRSFET